MKRFGRPRARGGRGWRGVRTRGGVNAGNDCGARGPSPESMLCGMLEDFREVDAIEKGISPKKSRMSPAKRRALKSSRSRTASTVGKKPEASASPGAAVRVYAGPSGADGLVKIEQEMCSSSHSRGLSFKCIRSGGSTPSTPATPSTPVAPTNPYVNTIESPRTPKSKRRLFSPSSSATAPVEDRPTDMVTYGSEAESDDEVIEDCVLQQSWVPRASRMFFLDYDFLDDEQTTNDMCLQWLPELIEIQAQCSTVSEKPPSPHPIPNPGGIPHEPRDKFDFKWQTFPEIQTDPALRREPFTGVDCGPTIAVSTPYEAFTAIWDREIMEHIAMETNRYAQQLIAAYDFTQQPRRRLSKWKDTDTNELYLYFAIILASGIVVKSMLAEYWNTNRDIFYTPGFTASMRYDRFYLLSRCLHFSNNDDYNSKTLSRSEAKLCKLQPILNHLNNKFTALYNLSQNIALDESLSMWKGILCINQFNKNKSAAIGIKTYEICESQTGYLWRFEVYGGHNNTTPSPQENSPISGTVPSLVLRLLNGLEHKGHTVWMDNYYNSPALARELKTRGIDCVGTLRTNRRFVPTNLASLKKNDIGPGQVFGCTSGDVDLLLWRDHNRVGLISTYHGLATVNCDGVLKPSIVPDYNICMGGVDRKDQMLATYPIERKRGQVWYKKFFKRLMNASVLNAYIIYRKQTPIDHRNFRKTLVTELIARHRPPEPCVNQPTLGGHFPAQYDLVGNMTERSRRRCKVCGKRTSVYCEACNEPLCVFTCFKPYHTQKHFRTNTQF